MQEGKPAAIDEELGDLLFSVVNLIRFRNRDPEVLMASANAKFEQRFGAMERDLRRRGLCLADADAARMEESWEAAKG
jgi:uncharacterized protein YabN with tetrapyrrole methylase and pyrophosphatase domain